ncbi:MAG: guanylate kinase, partial [Zetaproteobacteria bacterium CG_4_9_14_3_um_filter_53_7]
PAAVRLFILPPSLDELRRRLTLRAQDDAQVVAARVAAAEEEMSHAGEAHFQVINDNFDAALERLVEIFR